MPIAEKIHPENQRGQHIDGRISPHPISLHRGEPKELIVRGREWKDLRGEAGNLPSIPLTERQTCDIELMSNGGLSPLNGFMGQRDYESVRDRMRLANGTIWPMPITLDIPEHTAQTLFPGQRLTLKHAEGNLLAVMTVSDLWTPDREEEAKKVYGTSDLNHPGVNRLLNDTNPVYIGGDIEGLELPNHHKFAHLRHTPKQLRQFFAEKGWKNIVGFQTRNPMHRAHVALTKKAMEDADAGLLIHPAVGPTQFGDIDPFVRTKAHEAILGKYPPGRVRLSLLQLAMRMAGPREATYHAIVRKNHGCTHFIVGRDHAGPSSRTKDGEPFYEPQAAQQLASQFENELGIKILPYEEMVFDSRTHEYKPASKVPPEAKKSISGTEMRRRLREREGLPNWLTYPEVAKILEKAYIPPSEQGIVIFFTGLSGSGKSTIANALEEKLKEISLDGDNKGRKVNLLDGDKLRTHLTKGLGFSRADRDTNVTRVGYVAGLVAGAGGIAITALIAPYKDARGKVRKLVEEEGGAFIEVHVDTPLEECEKRDVKGLYRLARDGKLKGMTGIDDPYEPPKSPEITINGSGGDAGTSAEQIISYLKEKGFIKQAHKTGLVKKYA